MAAEICFICEQQFEESEKTRTARKRGVESLISASIQREDNKHRKYNLKNEGSVTVHDKCYLSYTSDSNIRACKLLKGAQFGSTSTRATHSAFDFEENCLFCGKDASENFVKKQTKKTNVSKRQSVRKVTAAELQSTILRKAGERSDKWGIEVLNRVASVTSLVAVKARYHTSCNLRFLHSKSGGTDKSSEDPPQIVELIRRFIENHPDERSFSLKDVIAGYGGQVASNQQLKKKLYDRLGDDIMITSNSGSEPIIHLRDAGNEILLKKFGDSHNEESDRNEVVIAAAKIITDDIRAQEYDVETYPSPDSFFENVENVIPHSLRTFLDNVVRSEKLGKETDKCLSKIASIAHAIISSVRPQSFLSCIKIGLGAVLNKKFGSKSLLSILSSLGFCCSYDEALLFEASVVSNPNNCIVDNESFSQFVFDNADHNVNTIDGLHTIHTMSGIECVTPASGVEGDFKIPKLKAIPSEATMGSYGTLPLKDFHGYKEPRLENVPIVNFNLTDPTFRYNFDISSTDLLWIYNQKVCSSIDVRGWDGFMENLTQDRHYTKSRIVSLPCLNHPSNNYDSIYTVLTLAAERVENKKQKIAFVTFDQPLYWKAKEIIHSTTDPKLENIVVRLGGFHLVVSFLGSIGQIMDGSGLKELFSTFYAEAFVDEMLAGHAYSRAVRAHILVHCALVQIILGSTSFTDEESSKLQTLLEASENIFETISTDVEFQNIKAKFIETANNFSGRSPTAKLWIQYVQMVSLLKMFIEAEKSGNWQLHLDTVQKMLPFFHASGHYLYAKSAHLYLQEMYNLKERMDEAEYEQFVKGGFTIRRTDKFWSGIWSDMTIKQFPMKAFKDIRRPTRGREMTDRALSKWVMSTPALIDLLETLTEFCKVFPATTEQHVDARATSIARDVKDMSKIMSWLADHNTFPETEGLISLSSGLKCGKDDNINCHQALEVGLRYMDRMMKVDSDGKQKCLGTLEYESEDKIVPLKALVSSIEYYNTSITIDPCLLFERLRSLKQSWYKLWGPVTREMAPFPLSMFTEKGLRKNVKSKLYDSFNPINPPIVGNDIYVIDGGCLLHKVIWQQKEMFDVILTRYVDYLSENYSKNCIVVFDGYPEGAEGEYTKSAERSRRAAMISAPEVVCDFDLPSTLPQDKFLSNDKNALHFIGILTNRLRTEGFGVKQAVEDADTLIIETAIDVSDHYDSVYVVGENVDLLVILSQIAKNRKNIYLMKPSQGNVEQEIYSVDSFKYPEIQHLICFIHAFTGCDTTSALYRQGKSKLMRLLRGSSTLRRSADVFNKENAEVYYLYAAGRQIVLSLYGAKDKDNDSLESLRYRCFVESKLKPSFELSTLPPTADALNQHCLRTYLQTRVWQGDHFRDPMEWGWKKSNNILVPITTRENQITPSLLELISCVCDENKCPENSLCHEVGLKCSVLCDNRSGQTCSNVYKPDIILSDDENDNDLLMLDSENASDDDGATLSHSRDQTPDESEPVAKKRKM